MFSQPLAFAGKGHAIREKTLVSKHQFDKQIKREVNN